MSKVLAKGSTVEEAIVNGLAELKIDRDDASIRVVATESKGFLGFIGRKPAEVEIARKDEAIFYSDKLSQILKKMGFGNVSLDMENANGIVHLNIASAEDMGGLLIGRSGRTLDAMEHLLRRIAENKGFDTKKVKLDVENYRKRSGGRERFSNRSDRSERRAPAKV